MDNISGKFYIGIVISTRVLPRRVLRTLLKIFKLGLINRLIIFPTRASKTEIACLSI